MQTFYKVILEHGIFHPPSISFGGYLALAVALP